MIKHRHSARSLRKKHVVHGVEKKIVLEIQHQDVKSFVQWLYPICNEIMTQAKTVSFMYALMLAIHECA